MKLWALLTVACFLVFSVVVPTRADLIVSIGNLTLPVGGTGYVDVLISSNSPTGDLLNAFNLDFRIGTQGQTRLEFVSPQPDPQLTDTDYVFRGNSFANDDPLNLSKLPVGTVSMLNEPNDHFVGGDSTADLTDVSVTAASKLLARLQVTAATGLPPNVGDSFTVSLNTSSSSFQHGDIGSPVMVSFSGGSSGGTINVVPEPTTLITMSAGLVAMFCFWFLKVRLRRHQLI